jgi:hypothetical protein
MALTVQWCCLSKMANGRKQILSSEKKVQWRSRSSKIPDSYERNRWQNNCL